MSGEQSAHRAEGEVLPGDVLRSPSQWSTVTAQVHGLGGLGVVGLTRLLGEALRFRFPRTATTETRGIAQRRAPVSSLVRAGQHVRSAMAPSQEVPLIVALEAGEALRALPSMAPDAWCLLCDLSIAPSTATALPPATPEEIGAWLESRGVHVVHVQVQRWLTTNRLNEALVSTVAFGALTALLDLPTAACESLLTRPLLGRRRDDNAAAFRWGVSQLRPPHAVSAAPVNLSLPHDLPLGVAELAVA